MSWFELQRVPEPEAMDDSGEVEAYSSATAQAHLDKIDDTFVEQAMCLIGSGGSVRNSGWAVDIGTGPGQIVLKLAQRLPNWRFVGVDRSANMIRHALRQRDSGLAGRLDFLVASGSQLPFPNGSCDLVLCNSVLHHLGSPAGLLSEIARIVTPVGTILVRDLRRPSRLAYPLHVRWYGRHYDGLMHRLYCDSVQAAYTPAELEALLRSSPMDGTRVFTFGRTHLGIERLPG